MQYDQIYVQSLKSSTKKQWYCKEKIIRTVMQEEERKTAFPGRYSGLQLPKAC